MMSNVTESGGPVGRLSSVTWEWGRWWVQLVYGDPNIRFWSDPLSTISGSFAFYGIES